MHKKIVAAWVIAILMALSISVSAETEHYIRIEITSSDELLDLTKLISIDHVSKSTVLAYATSSQLQTLDKFGYAYAELPHPGGLIDARMSDSKRSIEAWDVYPTYDAYVAMMNQFAIDYPSICEIVNIGSSTNGRSLLFARISDNVATSENEPEVMYTSSMHGDEITGYVLSLRLIDSLLSAYGSDSRITAMVNGLEIWINPLANPDGTYASGNHTVTGATRGNANFVDLNRNYPDPRTGDHPDGNAWQAETVAMMALAESEHFVLSANYHGGIEVLNYPWDGWSRRHADDLWWQFVCRNWADTAQTYSPSGYMTALDNGITNGWDWYSVYGGRQDYMNYWQGCREVTVELSDVKLVPANQLPAHWDYNRLAMLQWLENAFYGIRGLVTDFDTGLPIDATISILGHDEDSSEVYTDPEIGDYHRMIEAGTFDIVFSSFGYYPDTIFGVVTANWQVAMVDAALYPLPNVPALDFLSQDAGAIDPGDNALILITLENNGIADASGVVGLLSTADSYVTITQNTSAYPLIVASGTGTSLTPYEFSLSGSTPLNHEVSFRLDIAGDNGYIDSTMFSIMTGQLIEDFESGDFSQFAWTNSGDADWLIESTAKAAGSYVARSGDVFDDQSSQLQLTIDVLSAGDLSFDYKVSSESGWDFLVFSIDAVEQDSWSGEVDWTQATFPMSAGSHLLLFSYEKDGSVSNGSDAAWIDQLTFPPLISPPATCCLGAKGSIRLDDGITICEELSDQTVDVADLTNLIDHLFINFTPICCPEEADPAPIVLPDGVVDVDDLTVLIDHLFISFVDLPDCP